MPVLPTWAVSEANTGIFRTAARPASAAVAEAGGQSGAASGVDGLPAWVKGVGDLGRIHVTRDYGSQSDVCCGNNMLCIDF